MEYGRCVVLVSPTVVVAEWLRRWTRNPLGSSRAGSNPSDNGTVFIHNYCTNLYSRGMLAWCSSLGLFCFCFCYGSAFWPSAHVRTMYIILGCIPKMHCNVVSLFEIDSKLLTFTVTKDSGFCRETIRVDITVIPIVVWIWAENAWVKSLLGFQRALSSTIYCSRNKSSVTFTMTTTFLLKTLSLQLSFW